jgi:hypothetical protein
VQRAQHRLQQRQPERSAASRGRRCSAGAAFCDQPFKLVEHAIDVDVVGEQDQDEAQ